MIRPCCQCGREICGESLHDVAELGEVEVLVYARGRKVGARVDAFPKGLLHVCPECIPFVTAHITTEFHPSDLSRPTL